MSDTSSSDSDNGKLSMPEVAQVLMKHVAQLYGGQQVVDAGAQTANRAGPGYLGIEQLLDAGLANGDERKLR